MLAYKLYVNSRGNYNWTQQEADLKRQAWRLSGWTGFLVLYAIAVVLVVIDFGYVFARPTTYKIHSVTESHESGPGNRYTSKLIVVDLSTQLGCEVSVHALIPIEQLHKQYPSANVTYPGYQYVLGDQCYLDVIDPPASSILRPLTKYGRVGRIGVGCGYLVFVYFALEWWLINRWLPRRLKSKQSLLKLAQKQQHQTMNHLV